MFDILRQDTGFAVRALRKTLGFTVTAVLTLALGIGATTALFSVVYGVLLQPLPFQEPDRLVSVMHRGRNHGPATYLTYRNNQQTLEGIGAWDTSQVSVIGHGEPEQLEALIVSHETLGLLRVPALLGRLFDTKDDAPGQPLRAVLTYGYWQRRFGGDRNILDQLITIDGRPAEIVGVLPSSFNFPGRSPALVVPMPLDPATATSISFGFQALGRLKPGVTLAQANQDLARMIPLLPAGFERLQLQPNVVPLVNYVIGDIGRTIWILMIAVAIVLLIACGNVANLFLIRAEHRQQELNMRAALGASRGRIACALLSESILLAIAGGGVGIAIARAALEVLRAIAPRELPRLNEVGIHLPVLLFALSVSIVTGAMVGLFAVWRFGRGDASALTDRSRGDTPSRHRTRNALVVSQVALALMLLVVSGLMIRTVIALRQVDPGFDRPREVQTFRLAISPGVVADPEEAARTHAHIAEQLAQMPGVTSVGMATSITMDGENNGNSVLVEDFPLAESRLRRFKSVAPGYFETMGAPLVAGRSITWTEVFDRRPVALISETRAREYWGDPARALGRRIRTASTNPWREIVGVVGDEHDDGLDRQVTAIVYWPMLSDSFRWRTMAYAIRSPRAGTSDFLRELEKVVWEVNPNLPLASVQTLEEIRAASMARTSFVMGTLAIAASVALLLGVVGIYGAIAYVATQRTREIGIRLALGAQRGDVRRMFLRQGLWLTSAGIAIGLGGALLVARIMSGLLFGVDATDAPTYAAVSAALATVALAATYFPACRAARVDPMTALRAE